MSGFDWFYAVMPLIAVANFCLIAAGVRYPVAAWQFAALNGFILGVSLEHFLGSS